MFLNTIYASANNELYQRYFLTNVCGRVLFKKNDTANKYSQDIIATGDGTYKFYFKVENLKLMDSDYNVTISSKNISHFDSKNKDVEYWIALEPESKYVV